MKHLVILAASGVAILTVDLLAGTEDPHKEVTAGHRIYRLQLRTTEGMFYHGEARLPVGKLPCLTMALSWPTGPKPTETSPVPKPNFTGWTWQVALRGPQGTETERFDYQPFAAQDEPLRRPCLEQTLSLAQHFAPTIPGSYSVAVKLAGPEKQSITSPPLEFELFDHSPTANGISVAIESKVWDEVGWPAIRLQFTNAGRTAATILRPVDGSPWGWGEPHYWFVVRDKKGRLHAPGGRCGMVYNGISSWNVVELAPGQSKEVDCPISVAWTNIGSASVTFHYVMTQKPKEPNLEGVNNLFLGRLTSVTKTMDLAFNFKEQPVIPVEKRIEILRRRMKGDVGTIKR